MNSLLEGVAETRPPHRPTAALSRSLRHMPSAFDDGRLPHTGMRPGLRPSRDPRTLVYPDPAQPTVDNDAHETERISSLAP